MSELSNSSTVLVDIVSDHKWDDWRMEKVTMASHTGSHVDAPLHKLADGKSLDGIPLDSFVGQAVIADLRDVPPVELLTGGHLKRRLPDVIKDMIVLLMTRWGAKRAPTREPENAQTHWVLLESSLWIVEELNLPKEILDEQQLFEFWSLPINLQEFTGSFCRPVAVIR